MAQKIKGLTVEIGGDTTKLDKALKDVNKELRTTQADLKQVDRLLKFDPSNIELLQQKQRGLATAIEGTSKKMEALKQAAEQAKKKLEIGEISQAQFDQLTRSVIDTQQNLEKLQKEAVDTKNKLSNVSNGASDAASALSNLKTDAMKAGDGLDKATDAAKDFENVASKIDGAAGTISKGAAAVATAALATVPATEDFRDGMSKLEISAGQAGISLETVKENFRLLHQVTGDAETPVETLSNLLQTGFNESQIASVVDNLAGAVINFPETMNIESLAESLQETIATGEATGQYAELLDRLGIGASNATQYMEGLSEEQRKALNVQLLSNTSLSETNDKWRAHNQLLIESRDSQLQFKESMSGLAEEFAPLISKITDLASAFMDWFTGLSDNGQDAIITLGFMALALKPITALVDGVMAAFDLLPAALIPAIGKITAVAGALLLIVVAVSKVSDAWNNMTGFEHFVSILGIVTAAVAALAVAMGALTGPAGALVAAAGIAAGIGMALAAVHSANSRAAKSMSGMQSVKNYGGGGSRGGSFDPNNQQSQFGGGGYGGRSRMGGSDRPVVLQMDGATMARGMMPYLDGENQRMGVQLAGR